MSKTVRSSEKLVSFFLFFSLWASELLIFDLNIGFLWKNYVYSQLGMSRLLNFEEKTAKNRRGDFFSAAGMLIIYSLRISNVSWAFFYVLGCSSIFVDVFFIMPLGFLTLSVGFP